MSTQHPHPRFSERTIRSRQRANQFENAIVSRSKVTWTTTSHSGIWLPVWLTYQVSAAKAERKRGFVRCKPELGGPLHRVRIDA